MKQLEREQELYLQAFLNRTAQATDKSGKTYVYRTFTDFYDEAKRKQSVLGANYSKPVNSDLIAIARRMKKYNGKEVY